MVQQMVNRFHRDYPDAYEALRVDGATQADASGAGEAYAYGLDITFDRAYRRQSGSYYTNPELARRVCAEGLVDFCRIRYPELGTKFRRFFLEGTRDTECLVKVEPLLSGLSVADLAVGTGVFPVALIEVLVTAGVHPERMAFTLIDLHPEALQAARFHLYRFAKQEGIDIEIRGHTGDALLTAIEGGPFDLVVGNPPYLGEKNNKAYFRKLRTTSDFARRYEAKMDLFYFFVYRGVSLLTEKGVLSFITTSYFLTATGARAFRAFLLRESRLTYLENFGDEQLFSGASLHSTIFGVTPYHDLTTRQLTEAHEEELPPEMLFSPQGYLVLEPAPIKRTLGAIWEKRGFCLGDLYAVNQGIVTGFDRLRGPDVERYPSMRKGQGVFVHEMCAPELEGLSDLGLCLVPFYKNSDLGDFRIEKRPSYQLLYLVEEEIPDALRTYLSPFADRLSARREVQRGLRHWYQLTWGRKRTLFEEPAILCPQRARYNRFAYSEGSHYGSADIYYITGTYRSPYSLSFLLGYLNSSVVGFWLSHRGKRKGELLELYGKPLSEIPLPDALRVENRLITRVEEVVHRLIDRPRDPGLRRSLDICFYELFELDGPSRDRIDGHLRAMRGV